MSIGQPAANVVDFATYRARRNLSPRPGYADDPTPSLFMFTTFPFMIPMIAWIPVWGVANVTRYEGPPDE
jgi:hypothetical protein